MVDVSVIIPTYNRAESLRETLESLVNQQANGCHYEVIVVDNNSGDHTKKVVAEIADAHMDGDLVIMEMRKEDCKWLNINCSLRKSRGE